MELTKSQLVNLLVNKYQLDREWCNRQSASFLNNLYKDLRKNLNK